MTNQTTPSTTDEDSPTIWAAKALRIAFLAMAVVLLCIGPTALLMAINQQRTQHTADQASKQAEQLRVELQCRAVPTLAYDKESSILQAMIAEGLAGVAVQDFGDGQAFAERIRAQVEVVNKTLEAREKSLTDCAAD